MGARYYAAWLGRWTSADPMGIGADGPGLYNYTRGSPVVFTDPGGMKRTLVGGEERDSSPKPAAKPAPKPSLEDWAKAFDEPVDPTALVTVGGGGPVNTEKLAAEVATEMRANEGAIAEQQAADYASQKASQDQGGAVLMAFLRGTGLTSIPTTKEAIKERLANFDATGLQVPAKLAGAAKHMASNTSARLQGDSEAWAENAGMAVNLYVGSKIPVTEAVSAAAPYATAALKQQAYGLLSAGGTGGASFKTLLRLEQRAARSRAGGVVEAADTPLTVDASHPLLRSAPKHHIFPQAYRSWFQARGVDIDKYTIKISQGDHEALHYGGGPGKGGGYWNETIMKRLFDTEAQLGRQLTSREILQQGAQLRREAGLQNVRVEPYGR